MSDSIGMYLNEIGKVSLLDADEEKQLSRDIEEGHAAAERLANGERGAALRRAVAKGATTIWARKSPPTSCRSSTP